MVMTHRMPPTCSPSNWTRSRTEHKQWPLDQRVGYDEGARAPDWKTFDLNPRLQRKHLRRHGVEIGHRGECGLAWVPGLYFGIPANFTVNGRATGSDSERGPSTASRCSRRVLCSRPMPIFSLLLPGITLSGVTGDDGDVTMSLHG